MLTDKLLWYVFVIAFVATASAETFLPFRSLRSSTARRWISNTVLLAFSSVAVASVFRLSAVLFAARVARHGVLSYIPIPLVIRVIVGVVVLDLVTYTSHRLFHKFAVLWNIHQVHHCETDLDLTTGLRFHPLESLIVQGLTFFTIAVLGVPPPAVALYVLAVVVQDFFQHANLRLGDKVDSVLRRVVITPAVHRVHHSMDIAHQNANFGTIFIWWDRLFGTYMLAETGPLGLSEFPNGSELNPLALLVMPVRRKVEAPKMSAAAVGTSDSTG